MNQWENRQKDLLRSLGYDRGVVLQDLDRAPATADSGFDASPSNWSFRHQQSLNV